MVKKTATILMLLGLVAAVAFGQHAGSKAVPKRIITGDEVLPAGPHVTPPARPTAAPGDSLSFATYDYGSNGSANHNIINFGDGTIALGRMMAHDMTSGTTTRGSYYGYFDGTSWSGFGARVESARKGWTNIAQFVDFGGIEMLVSHTGMAVNVDAGKGQASWTSSTTGSVSANTWPKLAVGGGSYAHIVAGSVFIGYARSTDGGVTFDKIDDSLQASTSADVYDVAAQGSNVAIVAGNYNFNLNLWESTNNGDTWTKTTLWTVHADSGSLPPHATEFVPDGGVSVLYDHAGKVHIAASSLLSIFDSVAVPATYYSIDAPIKHWSAASGWTTIALPYQDTLLQQAGPGNIRNGNIATAPDLGVDASNNLYVVYENVVPVKDDSGRYVEHIYAAKSADGGATWGSAVDVTPGTGFAAQFCSMADDVGSDLLICYTAPVTAGSFIQQNNPEAEVPVMFLKVAASTLPTTAVTESGNALPEKFALNQNYPNPFNPSTQITYSIPRAANVKMVVYNVLGQIVATLVNENQNAGTHTVNFHASNLSSGVYFYSINAGNYSDVKKMVLMKYGCL